MGLTPSFLTGWKQGLPPFIRDDSDPTSCFIKHLLFDPGMLLLQDASKINNYYQARENELN